MMEDKIKILLPGMLDTKGDEFRWMAELVRYYGGVPVLMDLSLGGEAEWADIPLSQVLAETGHKPEDVYCLSRSDAVTVVSEAGCHMVRRLYQGGEVDGVLSWAGSIGTTVVSALMRELPLGVPKVMLSTSASGDVKRWLGLSDILIASPISEKGINRLTAKTVGKAAAGVVAMARAMRMDPPPLQDADKPMAGISLYGITTPTAMRCAEYMEQQGWDTLFFHQTGLGAVMEDLIREGEIQAVFDLTPAELVSNYFGSRNRNPDSWKGQRFTAAFEMGIPAVIAPGAMEDSPFGSWDALPEHFQEEFRTEQRLSYHGSGKPYFHSEQTLILPTTLEENRMFAHQMIEQINKAKGPVCLLVPMQGWSAYDQCADHASKDTGWAEGTDGPVWIGSKEHAGWSERAVQFWEIAEREVRRDKENIDAVKLDLHLLDPEFSSIACEAMSAMLNGSWRRGFLRGRPEILI